MKDDGSFEQQARAAFDASVERLDGATRSRLTQARHAAVAELGRPRGWMVRYAPLAAAASVALAVAIVLQPGSPVDAPPAPLLAGAEDFNLFTAGEDLELLGEDPDFYVFAAMADAGDGVG